jgi:hypothetical protein
MKTLKSILTLPLAFALVSISLAGIASAQDPQEQNQATAIMRGYRTGYSDGYQAGVSDVTKSAPREFRNKAEYDHADRAFNSAWGSVEEYRDGYRQGFEVGYNAGYDRKGFDSSIPADLKPRTEDTSVQYPTDQNKRPGNNDPTNTPTNASTNTPTNASTNAPANASMIPRDTLMRVELLNNISTDASQKGDPFQARVLEPSGYQGAVIEGHIEQVKRPGKAKGNAQLQLSFDQIKLSDGRSSKMSAQVIEVISNGSSEGVGKVDSEGGVQGSDSTKGDVQKVGAAAGIGAIIGLIAGGGTGAAIGATIGAGVGTAGVLTQKGKDIRLNQGQQLRIRTARDAEFQ